ncbi:nuclear hormone receptor FTZ-F1 beta-like isoform X2 [Watersipora subatra]|uniref:nuclear hormone receptor FTZ-F1 beta-like isoform X2 n=1 Tax=Watersipora subatra TaxID=2589382 RepID=UPI00355B0BD0
MTANENTQTVFIQTSLGDGDVGISPVLLQAVNQTLDSKTTASAEQVNLVVSESVEDVEHQPPELTEEQTVIIGSTEETANAELSNEEEESSPLMATTSPNKDGRLVIKVISDSFGDSANQEAIIHQLRQKLGIRVVVQMESTSGEVVFQGTVTPNNEREEIDSGMAVVPEMALGDKENEDVNAIVKSVVNTIRDISSKVDKTDMKLCPICGDAVTGFHYAVQTCESCKGFFKRTVQNKKAHTCHRGGTCDISLANRKKCAACRFQKCCDVGMKIEGVREDRSRGGRSKYYGTNLTFQQSRKRTAMIDNSPFGIKRIAFPELSGASPASYPSPIIPEIMQEVYALEELYEEPSSNPHPCCLDKLTPYDQDKFNSMLHLTEHRLHQIVKWARQLPNFLDINLEDQVLLLQNSWAELISLGAIWRSRFSFGVINLSFGKTLDLQKAREMEHEEVISRMLHASANFRRLDVDKYEYVTLKVLALMLPDIKGLKNASAIQDYQNKLLGALMLYTSTRYPNSPTKFGELLLRLSEVQRYTVLLRKQILREVKNGNVPEYDLIMYLLRGQSEMFHAAIHSADDEHIVVTLDDVSMGVS